VNQRGFTLIELMISLVMFSLAMMGVLSVASSISGGTRDQRQTVETEMAARSALDVMAQAIRAASPGVSSANIQHVQTCASGAISVVNSTTGPDEVTIVYASGSVVTASRTSYASGTTSLTVADATQLAAGDTILITDTSQASLVPITAVDASSGVLTLGSQTCSTLSLPSGGYAAGSLVVRVQRARFYIGSIDGVSTLMIDPDAEGSAAGEPLAEGIEDLQIALGVDANADGAISELGSSANDDEWAYNVSGDAALSGSIRGVRVSLVAKALKPLTGAATFTRPALEDHAAASTSDAYRRRVLSSVIEIRNLGGSP
jgi:prepilin-type N-terminal cleavage/methylation domain-containing protein